MSASRRPTPAGFNDAWDSFIRGESAKLLAHVQKPECILALDEDSEGIFDVFTSREAAALAFEASLVTKSRLGIMFLGALFWDGYTKANGLRQRSGQEPPAFTSTDQLRQILKEQMDELRLDLSRLPAPKIEPSSLVESVKPLLQKLEDRVEDAKERRAEDRTFAQRLSQTFLETEKALETVASVVTATNQAVNLDVQRREAVRIARAEERRVAASKKAEAKKVADEAAQKKAEKLKAEKAVANAKASRRKEVRRMKAKGQDPYTEAETARFAASLEKRGKVFYTPEQRAAYQKANPKSIRQKGVEAAKRKTFVNYTPEQKASYIKEKFTDAGKTYYSPAERRAYQASRKGNTNKSSRPGPKGGQKRPPQPDVVGA